MFLKREKRSLHRVRASVALRSTAEVIYIWQLLPIPLVVLRIIKWVKFDDVDSCGEVRIAYPVMNGNQQDNKFGVSHVGRSCHLYRYSNVEKEKLVKHVKHVKIYV